MLFPSVQLLKLFSLQLNVSISVKEAHELKRDGIAEPFVPKEWIPSIELGITFPNGKVVDQGNEIIPADSAVEPILSFVGDGFSTYTVLCFDPDAPIRGFGFLGPILHWAAGNVHPSPTAGGAAQHDPSLVFYAGPGPPPWTGLHRYIFLLYRNLTPEGLLPFEKQSKVKAATMGARMRCDVSLFVKENGLELVGVNWFQSKKA